MCTQIHGWTRFARRWLFGFDLDVLLFNRSKDGYSPFSALAGFAVAQSVALTAVARGDRGFNKWIVLFIYFVSVLVTLAWIVHLLRSTLVRDDQEPPDVIDETHPDSRRERIRAYDRTTILYGRWTLGWICIVAGFMCLLAGFNLLPNQTTRVEFANFPIECDIMPLANRNGLWPGVGGTVTERNNMDAWISLLSKTSALGPNQRMLWIEQKGKMGDNYNDTVGELKCNKHFKFVTRAAFLVKPERGFARPVYRQMDFRIIPGTEDDSNHLYLHEPNKDEFLVIIAGIESTDNEGKAALDNTGSYGISVELAK